MTTPDGCTKCDNLGITEVQGRAEYCICANGYAAQRLRVKLELPKRKVEPVGYYKTPGGLGWRGPAESCGQ